LRLIDVFLTETDENLQAAMRYPDMSVESANSTSQQKRIYRKSIAGSGIFV